MGNIFVSNNYNFKKNTKYLTCTDQSIETMDNIFDVLKSTYKTWKYYMRLIESKNVPYSIDADRSSLPYEVINFLEKFYYDDVKLFTTLRLKGTKRQLNNALDIKEYFRVLPYIYNNTKDNKTKKRILYDSNLILKTLTIHISKVLVKSCLMKRVVLPLHNKRKYFN